MAILGSMPKIFWFCAVLGVGAGLFPAEGEAAEKVRVVMFRVPEKMWQAELEGGSDTQALWKQLDQKSRQVNVQRTLDATCALRDDRTASEWKRGLDQEFTSSWTSDAGKIEVVPEKAEQRFVGTLLSMASLGPTPGGRLGVSLRLEHHTRPPLMMKHNYANAAEGPERERLSVEYPQFEKVVWQGRVAVDHEWRLVARVLHSADRNDTGNDGGTAAEDWRYLLFITRIRP